MTCEGQYDRCVRVMPLCFIGCVEFIGYFGFFWLRTLFFWFYRTFFTKTISADTFFTKIAISAMFFTKIVFADTFFTKIVFSATFFTKIVFATTFFTKIAISATFFTKNDIFHQNRVRDTFFTKNVPADTFYTEIVLVKFDPPGDPVFGEKPRFWGVFGGFGGSRGGFRGVPGGQKTGKKPRFWGVFGGVFGGFWTLFLAIDVEIPRFLRKLHFLAIFCSMTSKYRVFGGVRFRKPRILLSKPNSKTRFT